MLRAQGAAGRYTGSIRRNPEGDPLARILVVDDEEGLRGVIADALAAVGHTVAQAPDVDRALESLEEQPFDVLISDLRMPGALNGMDLVRHARAQWPDMQVIVLTAHGSIEMAVEATKLGAFDFLEKPIGSPGELRALVQRALNWRGAPHGNRVLRDAAPERARGPVAEFLHQLQRRHVYTVAVGYGAAGFLLLQGAELILPALNIADWVYTALVVITLAGFPIALVLGWVFDITSRGIRRTDDVQREDSA